MSMARNAVAAGAAWLAALLAVGGCTAVQVEPGGNTAAGGWMEYPAEPGGAGQSAIVDWVVDGDTLITTAGKVRVIGIDTPERGRCGATEATQNAAAIAPVGSAVVLTPATGKDDTDRYGRLLRYDSTADGTDLGLRQILDGYAIARYDSRDGYGAHPQEDIYIAADAASANHCD
jgi:endonuclease YncB( thermonuclease family)